MKQVENTVTKFFQKNGKLNDMMFSSIKSSMDDDMKMNKEKAVSELTMRISTETRLGITDSDKIKLAEYILEYFCDCKKIAEQQINEFIEIAKSCK